MMLGSELGCWGRGCGLRLYRGKASFANLPLPENNFSSRCSGSQVITRKSWGIHVCGEKKKKTATGKGAVCPSQGFRDISGCVQIPCSVGVACAQSSGLRIERRRSLCIERRRRE